MTRHFLRDDDVSQAEQTEILDVAAALKLDRFSQRPLAGPQTVAVFFDKTSTRTRVSFATGIADLGGSPLIINPGSSQLGAKESVPDTAKVLERMVAMIVWRTFAQSGLEEMAANSAVPVVNALSDDFHPCQILADLLTIREHKGALSGLSLAYVGDAANNMANSYLLGGATAGMDVRVAGPDNFLPRPDIVADAEARAAVTGGKIMVSTDPVAAVEGADVVLTDTWVSMGQESEKAKRLRQFGGFQVDAALMSHADDAALFMHCLPAYRGYEVAAEVIDGEQSVVWDEAENRLHAQKGLMAWLLGHVDR